MLLKIDFRKYSDPEKMASDYLSEVFKNQKIEYPINPFALMKRECILFKFMDCHNLEGVYIPADSEDDIPVVGINYGRQITRQRFTAAHELCHHFKDADKFISCPIDGKNDIEKFADRFASSLLMPRSELKTQIDFYRQNGQDGFINFDDVLNIAHFFGVSFQACLYRIAYDLNSTLIKESISEESIKQYAPDKQRKKLHLTHLQLYSDLLDCFPEKLNLEQNKHAFYVFQNKYLFNDSRMEGLNVSIEEVSEIVTDLRLKMQNSRYCREENEAYLSIAGHYAMYQEIFKEANRNLSIYDIFILNRKLFSCYPNPNTGGLARRSNTLVLGTKFETADYRDITAGIAELDKDINDLNKRSDKLSTSEFIKCVARIHHKLTVIHPFSDGNGRTARAFMNLQLVRAGLLPIYVKVEDKKDYLEALSLADKNQDYSALYEMFFKIMIRSHVELTSYDAGE